MNVNLDSLNNYFQWLYVLLLENIPKIIVAILILILGYIITKFVKCNLKKILFKVDMNKGISIFIGQIVQIIIIILIILTVLNTLGISTTPFTGGIVAILIGITISLKSSLNLLTSGILIIATRPFEIGDTVEINKECGKIEYINFVCCTLLTSDGRYIKIPNTVIISSTIINLSTNTCRRYDLKVIVNNNYDIVFIQDILKSIVMNEVIIPKIPKKAPVVKIDGFSENKIEFILRYWAFSENISKIKWDINAEIQKKFKTNDISLFATKSNSSLS